jgi:structural hemagglutinin/hemolysin toxin protein RtxA
MYILVTYIPQSHLEQVKEAIFAAGAGVLGAYHRCSYQTLGEGQFRPLSGSDPFIGVHGETAAVPEWRLEVTVAEDRAEAVIEALLASHPYEVVAYHLIAALTLQEVKRNG